MRRFHSIAELRSCVGAEVGVSPWLTITQEQVDAFAGVTGDHQWIHVDPARAAGTAFGGTIAHGLFTLSLGPQLTEQILAIEGVGFGVNYGYGKVRFPAPLPVGLRLRMRATLSALEDVTGGVQMTMTQTFEVEGSEKPVCVAESLGRLYPLA